VPCFVLMACRRQKEEDVECDSFLPPSCAFSTYFQSYVVVVVCRPNASAESATRNVSCAEVPLHKVLLDILSEARLQGDVQ
jgi:hypothetical protein